MDTIVELEAAIKLLETQKSLLTLDNIDLHNRISELQLTIAELRGIMDGMSEDMGLLEVRLLGLINSNDQ